MSERKNAWGSGSYYIGLFLIAMSVVLAIAAAVGQDGKTFIAAVVAGVAGFVLCILTKRKALKKGG